MATPAFNQEPSDITPLDQKIRNLITERGPIPFRDFMQASLYDEHGGFYAGQNQRVGKQGDFITSVSIGQCFGLILARRLAKYWQDIGKPETFHIMEPGAHNGALCKDILIEVQQHSPEFYHALHYQLIEATPQLRSAQGKNLGADFDGKFTSHPDFSEIRGVTGAIISNELIDAFPVDLIRRIDHEWRQLFVGLSDGEFEFINSPITDPALTEFCQSLDQLATYPDGYTTEYNPGLKAFAQGSAESLSSGLLITIDYGHHAEDYYHPDRNEGTLQTYHRHQKSDNPLSSPGEIDITCHVDFTRLENELISAGFSRLSLGTQASYLTNHAKQWLLDLEKVLTPETPALLRQFQTLTHPAMLGTRFMVLEMEK